MPLLLLPLLLLPLLGKEAWLRGSLAKWLLDAGFKGRDEQRKVLPRVMALGPEQPTVFRMDMSQAGAATGNSCSSHVWCLCGKASTRCWRHQRCLHRCLASCF
jgi:hypothetical protein